MDAILVEKDYKGQYERYALTPEEFKKEFPETVSKGEWPVKEATTDTIAPLVHIWFEPCQVGNEKWQRHFTDMEWGLPESDIEAGNLAYIREDLFQSLKEYLPENTQINYLYRDASNYKVHNSAIVAGKITDEQKSQIMDSLNDGEFFIPAKVGLPANRFETFTRDDHYWFEFDSFESTKETPTVSLTVAELVEAFVSCRDSWEDVIDKYGNLLSSEKIIKAINIEWDIDEDMRDVELPTEIELPKGMTDEDEISDYLSDITGFCHKGFELVESVKKVEFWYGDETETQYPILSASSDYTYLLANLSDKALKELEGILNAYDKDRIDFELIKDQSGYTADFRLIINDKDYQETGLEAVALKWSEAMESTDYLVDCFSEVLVYNSYRFTVDYRENGEQKSFQIGISSKEKPDSKWLAQKISNYFSAHYNGSVEKAIKSVEGIDVHIQDSEGEYVDSDEIYGDDLKELFEHLKSERYKFVVDDEIHYAMLTKSEVNRVKKDIAGELNCQFEITDENGEKIESGIIDFIEKVEKPGLDCLISSAQQKVTENNREGVVSEVVHNEDINR